MAYIYGQLEYCYLGVPIIRGYCSAKDLIFHSKAHPAYQRNADTKHIIDIVKFLKDSSLKFMPEIILAYDYTEMYKDTDQWRPPRYNDPIDYLYHGSSPNVTATSEKVSFQRLAIHTKGIRTIKIRLPDYYSSTDAKVFRRIDGNHRLEALEEIDLTDIVIPFCIVLLCSNVNATFAQREKDEIHSQIYTVLDCIEELHQKSAKIDLQKYPCSLYNLSYQDGVIHSFERYLQNYKTGEYCNPNHINRVFRGYEQIKQKVFSNGNYWDEAYYEGYINGLVLIDAIEENEEIIKEFPFYYLPNAMKALTSYEILCEELDRVSTEKDQYSKYANKIVKEYTTKDLIMHHPPY